MFKAAAYPAHLQQACAPPSSIFNRSASPHPHKRIRWASPANDEASGSFYDDRRLPPLLLSSDRRGSDGGPKEVTYHKTEASFPPWRGLPSALVTNLYKPTALPPTMHTLVPLPHRPHPNVISTLPPSTTITLMPIDAPGPLRESSQFSPSFSPPSFKEPPSTPAQSLPPLIMTGTLFTSPRTSSTRPSSSFSPPNMMDSESPRLAHASSSARDPKQTVESNIERRLQNAKQNIRSVHEIAKSSPAPTSVQTRRSRAPVNWLLRLPPRFWDRMGHLLTYQEILNLALLSRQFSMVKVERFLPWELRSAKVHAFDITPHITSARGCYICYTVKDARFFQTTGNPDRQKPQHTWGRVVKRDPYLGVLAYSPVAEGPTSRATSTASSITSSSSWTPRPPGSELWEVESLRNYCIACSLRYGLAQSGDLIFTATGETRWVCKCLKDNHQIQDNRCATCGMTQVLRTAYN